MNVPAAEIRLIKLYADSCAGTVKVILTEAGVVSVPAVLRCDQNAGALSTPGICVNRLRGCNQAREMMLPGCTDRLARKSSSRSLRELFLR